MGMLDNLKILENLSYQEKESLEMFCQERTLEKGEILFEEGDEASSMYLLSEGEVEIFIKKGGKEKIIARLAPESIIGEMAIFSPNNKRMAGARAIKKSRLIVLLKFSVEELVKKHPDIFEKIKDLIEQRNHSNAKAEII